MTQQDPDQPMPMPRFQNSEAALAQYKAAMRRGYLPTLAMLPTFIAAFVLEKAKAPGAVVVVLLVAGLGLSFAILVQNFGLQKRASQRLKTEVDDWIAEQEKKS